MKIGIYGQFYHENSETYIKIILETLQENDLALFIEENFLEMLSAHDSISEVLKNVKTFRTKIIVTICFLVLEATVRS